VFLFFKGATTTTLEEAKKYETKLIIFVLLILKNIKFQLKEET
jgi:hypothetical protein